MKRGRIWFVTRALPVHRPGGMERVVQEVAFGLARRGWQVTLVTPRVPEAVACPAGVDLQALDAPATVPSAAIPNGRFARALCAWAAARADRPDLIFAATFAAGPLVARRRDIPALFQAHGSSWSEAMVKLRAGDPRGLYRLWLHVCAERRALALYDRIVAVGPAVAARLGAPPYRFLERRRIVEIANGIDLSLFAESARTRERLRGELDAAPDERIVLSVGRLVRGKGVLDLLRACAQLPDRARVRIVIAGAGPDAPALHAYAARERLTGVRFLGAVPRARVIEIAQAADALAQVGMLPEGLPLTVLEALCAGCPVVVSEGIRLPSFGGEAAIFRARPGDPASIRTALQAALRLEAPLPEVARAARERFSLERTLDAYERVVGEILAERAATRDASG